MPPPETVSLLQRAVLWPRSGTDDYGQPSVGTPVEISVRWKTERREVVNAQGDTIALDATVIVAQKIAIGSWMWLGKLSDWYTTGSASNIQDEELMEVHLYDETPDIKNRIAFRQVGLMRLHNKGAG